MNTSDDAANPDAPDLSGDPASVQAPAPEPATLADVRRRAEDRLARRVGQRVDEHPPGAENLVHELGVQQIELEIQNEQLAQTQVALESSRDRLAALYEHAPVGYLTLHFDGRIVEANRLAAAMLGRPRPRLLGHRLLEMVATPDQPQMRECQKRTLRGEAPQTCEFRLDSPAPQARWLSVHMALATDAQGTPQCRVALVDITQRVSMQDDVAHLAAIVSASDDVILSRTLDGRLMSWNRGAERLLGYSAQQMLGRPLDALIPDEQRAAAALQLARLRRGETIAQVESEWLDPAGRRIPLSLSLSPIRDEAGQVVGSSLIGRDISGARAAEAALRKRLRQLDLLSQAGQAMIMGEFDGSVPDGLFGRVRAAVGAEIHMHYAVTEGGKTLRLVSGHGLPERCVAGSELPLESSLCGLAARRMAPLQVEELQHSTLAEATLLKSTGARCYAGFPLIASGRLHGVAAFASTSFERFADGDVQLIGTVCDQVSAMLERARLVDRLQAREQALKQADRDKDDFIATLAHELRNPLAPIRSAVAILQHHPLADPQLARCRDIIGRQVEQITHLLEDLLDVSRITRKRVELHRARIDLRGVLERAIESVRPRIDAQSHRLALEGTELPCMLDADPVRLTQIFANLLDNAAKYTGTGGDITLSVRREGGQVRVGVRDTGIGIEAARLAKVFEMVSPLAPVRERLDGGLGIGLALARGLVELHGGRIAALSAGVGRGSEFVVYLPLGAGPAPAAPAAARAQMPRRHRVLVVDDNEDAATTLATLLELRGHDTRFVVDSREAMRIAEHWRPSVALLDIGMPDIDGFQLCRMLRAQPWGRTMLLIACTGWGQAADRERARHEGFDFHLVKPVSSDEILALLERHPVPQAGAR